MLSPRKECSPRTVIPRGAWVMSRDTLGRAEARLQAKAAGTGFR